MDDVYDLCLSGSQDEELFGRAVAMSRSHLAVAGLRDAVHMLDRDTREEQILSGQSGSEFGKSVAMTGTHLAVGAPGYHTDTAEHAGGAVHVYAYDGSVEGDDDAIVLWSEQRVLYCGGDSGTSRCGSSVALSGVYLAMLATREVGNTGALPIFFLLTG